MRRDEQGFTLIELLVVLMVLPLVVGAISVALLSVFKLQSGVSNRISDSGDAQVVSAHFVRDVQSAATIWTSSAPQCGSGSQVLGLSWVVTPSSGVSQTTTVSYVKLPEGTTYSMFRQVCQGGSVTTPTSTSVVSHDLSSSQAAATITCASTATGCAAAAATTAGAAAAGVAGVKLAITEPASSYSYSLTAVPRDWASAAGGAPPVLLPILPLQLLGNTSCPSTVLSIIQGSQVTVGGSGAVGVTSPCPAAISTDGSTLAAAGITTSDSQLSSFSQPSWDTQSQPPETYLAGGPPNPFASLTVPSNPSTASLASVSCTTTGSSAACPPGEYKTSPTFANGGTALTFGTGTFVFDSPVSIGNNDNVTFGGGTYWFEEGLTIGAVTATFGSGNYSFGSTGWTGNALHLTNGSSVTTGAGGVLFYVETGSVSFDEGASVTLTATTQNRGMAIWDVGATGTTNPLTLTDGTSVNSLGGIYVPLGQIVLSGGGTLTAKFVVTGTASLSNGTSLAVG